MENIKTEEENKLFNSHGNTLPGSGHLLGFPHIRVSLSDPVHCFPPFAGGGFVHERRRS